MNEINFRKAVNGDWESFYKMVEPIKDSLYKIAFMYVENEDDALDCVQDAMIKAIRYLRNLKEPQYFNTWITRITINSCKDFIKKNNRAKLVDISDYENILTNDYVINENDEEFLEIISKLSDRERDLIIMRYLDDMSLKDIAKKSKEPLGTIKSRMSRTLKKLRVHVGGIGYEK